MRGGEAPPDQHGAFAECKTCHVSKTIGPTHFIWYKQKGRFDTARCRACFNESRRSGLACCPVCGARNAKRKGKPCKACARVTCKDCGQPKPAWLHRCRACSSVCPGCGQPKPVEPCRAMCDSCKKPT